MRIALIREHFTEAGLLIPAVDPAFDRGEIFAAGRKITDSLIHCLGWWTVIPGLNAFFLPNFASGGISLLGWSYYFTNFLAGPLVPVDSHRHEISSLGAIANLIVNLYDHRLDRKKSRAPRLSAEKLERLQNPSENIPVAHRLDDRLLEGLIGEYYHRLNRLTCLEEKPGFTRFINRTILRMLAAENRVHNLRENDRSAGRRLLLVKDIFPFLIMGAPAWAFERSTSRQQAHFFFIYNVGKFIGLLDDAVDLDLDLKSGHPNYWAEHNTTGPNTILTDREISEILVDLGLRIFRQWDNLMMDQESSERDTGKAFFRHSVSSWFYS